MLFMANRRQYKKINRMAEVKNMLNAFTKHDARKEIKRKHKSGVIAGLAAGAAIGAAAGVLLAPKSGKETRQDIKEKAVETAGIVKEKSTDAVGTIKKKIEKKSKISTDENSGE
jgi:hypothetical protein